MPWTRSCRYAEDPQLPVRRRVVVRRLRRRRARRRRLYRLGALTNLNMGLTVSSDGKTIIYGRENLAGADLMMLENFR